MRFFLFLVFISINAFASLQGQIVSDQAIVYKSAGANAQKLGVLRKGSTVAVISKNENDWYLIQVSKKTGETVEGYVSKNNLKITEEVKAAAVVPADVDNTTIAHPWSVSFGFGGYSMAGQNQVNVGSELRYRWNKIFESIFGLDLSFGSETFLGAAFAQRAYVNLAEKFKPFVEIGYRISKITDYSTSAIEFGGGFQVQYGELSYFEVCVSYLWRGPFSDEPSGFIFGGSSGIRF